MYQQYPYNISYQKDGDRLIFPFLTGALVGGAAVGLTRPRPIYNVAPYPYYPPRPVYYGPYGYPPYGYYPYGK